MSKTVVLATLLCLVGCHRDLEFKPPKLPPPTVTADLGPGPQCACPQGFICVNAACVACGDAGEACCQGKGSYCNDPLVCGSDGTCSAPASDLDPAQSPDMAPACGGDQQACCTGYACTPGDNCIYTNETTGTCAPVPCGGLQQVCCEDPASRCGAGLECDTGFCQAKTDGGAGDMTPPTYCDYNQDCTFSYGYWKQHWVCSIASLTLGTVAYTHDQLLEVLNQPVNNNGLVDLAHQLIGAKMNVIKGADAGCIQASVDAADALIGGLVVPPVGLGSLATTQTAALSAALENFNLGQAGVPHCP